MTLCNPALGNSTFNPQCTTQTEPYCRFDASQNDYFCRPCLTECDCPLDWYCQGRPGFEGICIFPFRFGSQCFPYSFEQIMNPELPEEMKCAQLYMDNNGQLQAEFLGICEQGECRVCRATENSLGDPRLGLRDCFEGDGLFSERTCVATGFQETRHFANWIPEEYMQTPDWVWAGVFFATIIVVILTEYLRTAIFLSLSFKRSLDIPPPPPPLADSNETTQDLTDSTVVSNSDRTSSGEDFESESESMVSGMETPPLLPVSVTPIVVRPNISRSTSWSNPYFRSREAESEMANSGDNHPYGVRMTGTMNPSLKRALLPALHALPRQDRPRNSSATRILSDMFNLSWTENIELDSIGPRTPTEISEMPTGMTEEDDSSSHDNSSRQNTPDEEDEEYEEDEESQEGVSSHTSDRVHYVTDEGFSYWYNPVSGRTHWEDI